MIHFKKSTINPKRTMVVVDILVSFFYVDCYGVPHEYSDIWRTPRRYVKSCYETVESKISALNGKCVIKMEKKHVLRPIGTTLINL